jgi:hypothetical protein
LQNADFLVLNANPLDNIANTPPDLTRVPAGRGSRPCGAEKTVE